MTTTTPRMFQAIGRLNRTRSKLVAAVRDTSTLPELRAAILELASDVEAFLDGHVPASELGESARDTEPCPPPWAPRRASYRDIEEDSAPCVPVNRPSGGP